MSELDVLLYKFLKHPQKLVITSREFEKILNYYDFHLKRVNGSHRFYVREMNDKKLTFIDASHSKGKEVGKIYIRKFYNLLLENNILDEKE